MNSPVDAKHRNGGRALPERLVQLYAGLTLYGAATALRLRANLGLDPWGAFHQGVSKATRIDFGIAVIAVGAVVLLLWIPLRQKPGLGTISNIVVIGLAADGALALVPDVHWWPARWICLLAGTALTGIAGAAYMGAGLGTGPRDGLMMGIVARTGWPVRRVRGGMELTVLAAGWLLGGAVGIGTIVHALLIGPFLDVSMRRLSSERPE
jgi:uncharacterized membrane protein YczE